MSGTLRQPNPVDAGLEEDLAEVFGHAPAASTRAGPSTALGAGAEEKRHRAEEAAPAAGAGAEEGRDDEAWAREEAVITEALEEVEAMLRLFAQADEAQRLARADVDAFVAQLTALMVRNSRWVSRAQKRFLTISDSGAIQGLLAEARTHWDPPQTQAAVELLAPLRERLRLVRRLRRGHQTFDLAVRYTDDLRLALRRTSDLLDAFFTTGAWTKEQGGEAAETFQRLQYLTLGAWLAQVGRIEWLGPVVERIYGVLIEQIILALCETPQDELQLMLSPAGGVSYGLDRRTAEAVAAAVRANVGQGAPELLPAGRVLSALQEIEPGQPVLAQVIHRLVTARSAAGLESWNAPLPAGRQAFGDTPVAGVSQSRASPLALTFVSEEQRNETGAGLEAVPVVDGFDRGALAIDESA